MSWPTSFAALLLAATIALASAAGSGAGAGGAGSQRAINSGLPPGEAGPAGAPNKRGEPAPVLSSIRGIHRTPRPEAPGGAEGRLAR